MTTMTITEAGKDFAGTLRRVRRTRMPVIIESRGKVVAVMLPPAVLDALEDLRDIQEADRVMKAIESGREKTIPWEDVKAKARL